MNTIAILQDADQLSENAEQKFAEGLFAEAELLYLEALGIREYVAGSRSHLVRLTLENLALTYDADGKSTEAEKIRRRARAAWESNEPIMKPAGL
jgi:hypothetical protein